jgi:hypothetical protein
MTPNAHLLASPSALVSVIASGERLYLDLGGPELLLASLPPGPTLHQPPIRLEALRLLVEHHAAPATLESVTLSTEGLTCWGRDMLTGCEGYTLTRRARQLLEALHRLGCAGPLHTFPKVYQRAVLPTFDDAPIA